MAPPLPFPVHPSSSDEEEHDDDVGAAPSVIDCILPLPSPPPLSLAPQDVRPEDRPMVLSVACLMNRRREVRELLDAGTDPNSFGGSTFLNVCELLYLNARRYRALRNTRCHENLRSCVAIVRDFLAHGADPNTGDGRTFAYVRACGLHDLTREFLERGADPRAGDIWAQGGSPEGDILQRLLHEFPQSTTRLSSD